MLSIRHSIGKTPLLEHMANDSKSVAHFRCYAIAPPTGVYAPADPCQPKKHYLIPPERHLSRAVVLFIDEIDSLAEDLLISVLWQLRMGYADRPTPFRPSIALVCARAL